MLAPLAFALLAGCARPTELATFTPCPPQALPVCHADASGCATAPFCYRTLGVVECYGTPEALRRTAEEVVAPIACPLSIVSVRPSG